MKLSGKYTQTSSTLTLYLPDDFATYIEDDGITTEQIDGLTSDLQDQLDARCLELVFGTAIGTGLLLDTATLQASAILQKYHGVDPAANVLSLLGAADYAAMMALLSGTATAGFSFNSQNLTSVGGIVVDDGGTIGQATGPLLTFDDTNNFLEIMGCNVGIGTASPDSILHIKANFPGVVGSDYAGQLIIQDPDDTVFGNAVITGYESDGAGNLDQQLWYLGSSSVSNSDIIFLNRRNSKLQLGTNGVSRLTILGNGNVGIDVTDPDTKLEVFHAGNQLKLSFDATDNAVFAVDTNGVLTITPSGAAVDFASKNFTSVGTIGCGAITSTTKFTSRYAQPGLILIETDGNANENWWIDCEGGILRFLIVNDALSVWSTAFTVDQSLNVNISAHDAATVGLKLGGTLVTASAAELNEAGTFFASTDISAAEAETLTDTSDADALHTHDTKQSVDATLTAFASLLTAANKIPYATNTDTGAELDLATTVGNPGSDTTLVSEQGIREAIAAVGAHAILDGTIHTDSVADAVTRGSIIYGNATPAWDELVIGTGFLRGDGTDCAWLSYANSLAALSATAGATFDWNDQQISNIKSIAFNDGGATITQIKDEDDMASDSATMGVTQQSIKAYIDLETSIWGTL